MMPQNPAQNRSAAPPGRAGYAKSRDTRARILAAALAEASEAGFHKASVAGIAARAGVAVGNLHYHFGSRRELLRELMGSLVADLMARLHAADADDSADFFDRQRAGLLVYLDYLRANPTYIRLAD
jgi:AcrR family transcriptional regulator